jgi:hypothetical protein
MLQLWHWACCHLQFDFVQGQGTLCRQRRETRIMVTLIQALAHPHTSEHGFTLISPIREQRVIGISAWCGLPCWLKHPQKQWREWNGEDVWGMPWDASSNSYTLVSPSSFGGSGCSGTWHPQYQYLYVIHASIRIQSVSYISRKHGCWNLHGVHFSSLVY